MNRYYNAEHIKKLIESHEWRMTLAKERGGNGFVEYDKLVLDSKEFQKRLSSLPTIEIGNVNDDLIKRQDVIKIIDKYYKQFVFISDADEVIAEIESLQTIIPSKVSCAEGKSDQKLLDAEIVGTIIIVKSNIPLKQEVNSFMVRQKGKTMSKYIKLDDAINDLDVLWNYDTVDGICSSTVLKQVKSDLLNLPTIEIVRCKDCKYSRFYALDSNEEPQRWCTAGIVKAVDDDDYCSWGE